MSSDDPEAIPKLRAKLEALEASRARMARANKAVRSKDPRGTLAALGYSPTSINKLLERDFAGRVGFPDYALRNAAGEAARLRKRIEELESRASRPATPPVELPGVRIEEADNRVRIIFDDKPAEFLDSLGPEGRWFPLVAHRRCLAAPRVYRRLVRGEADRRRLDRRNDEDPELQTAIVKYAHSQAKAFRVAIELLQGREIVFVDEHGRTWRATATCLEIGPGALSRRGVEPSTRRSRWYEGGESR